MHSPLFKTLFHLSNDEIDIIEIKRLGFPPDSAKSLLFYWLLIRKETVPERLTFMKMSDGNKNQSRDFKEGVLIFNDTAGNYTPTKSEKSYRLDVITPPSLNSELIQIIENYLS